MVDEKAPADDGPKQAPERTADASGVAEAAPAKQSPPKRFTARQVRLERRRRQRRKRTGAVMTFILVGVFALGTVGYIECIQSTPGPSSDVTKGIVLGPVTAARYKDGITEGRSKRWYVRVRVRVRFFQGRIDKIDILQHRTIWSKARRAAPRIADLIVETQNTRVKAVSGATLSSQAIMLAVQDALTNNQNENKWKPYEETGEGGYMKDRY
jgi:uncharacterized protein with FMN-binding domain